MLTIIVAVCLVVMVTPLVADVVISDCHDAADWNGPVTLDSVHARTGGSAIRWHFGSAPTVGPKVTPTDWTAGDALSFWLYSETLPVPAASGLTFEPWVHVYGQAADGQPGWYVGVHMRIDYTGWRHYVIPFEEFDARATKAPVRWDRVERITFDSARGLWLRPAADPATVMLIDDLRVTKIGKPGPGQGPRLTDEQFFAALDLDRPDLAAVKAAVGKGDYATARREFASHIRSRRSPRWLQMWWERPAPDPQYKTAGADKIVAGEIDQHSRHRRLVHHLPQATVNH